MMITVNSFCNDLLVWINGCLEIRKVFFFRFCQARWIDDQPVAGSVLEIWPSAVKIMKYWQSFCKSK